MKRATKITVMTVLFCIAALLLTNLVFAADTWDLATAIQGPQTYAATATINGKLYVVGGYNYSVLNTLRVYDPLSGTWDNSKKVMPTARYLARAAAIDGKLYVVGGIDGQNHTLNKLEVYDPVQDTWSSTEKQPMIKSRFSPAIGNINGKLYVAGGGRDNSENTGVPHDSVEMYDPIQNTWVLLSSTATMSIPLYDSAYGVIDGKLYVAGGWNGTYATNEVEVFDPVAQTWTTKAPMSTIRQNPAFDVINGQLFVAGGWDRPNNVNLASFEVYNPASNTWATKISMSYARTGAAGGGMNGKFYVVGGYNNGNLTVNEVFLPNGICY